MMKVVSFSLWGDKPMYTSGAIVNAELSKVIYPDWICRYHCGETVPDEIISKLQSMDNVEIINRKEDCNWTGMFWRFEDASDPKVDIMISRDCDSRLCNREASAVKEWENSDKKFHIMRDHPSHGVPILGGMWGAKKSAVSNMVELINSYVKGDFWQVDQDFLREVIYPIVKDDSVVHDEFFEKKPFPEKRNGYNFVGQVYDEKEETVREHLEIIKKYLEGRR